MMPAAKALDPLLGIDIHIMQPPGPVPPVPLPNPYIGMVFDPMDFVPFLGATTRIAGLPRAQAGSAGQALPPHLPIGGVFVKPPSNESEIFMGSAIVSLDGEAASYMALPVLSCVCVGMPPIPRLKKKKAPTSMVLPLTKVLAIPSPVFIGGPPTISLTAMAGRAGLGNLLLLKAFIESGGDPMILLGFVAGKLMGKLQGLANKGLGKLTNKLFNKVKGKGKGAAKTPKGKQGQPHGNGATCAAGNPVDSVTGEYYENYLDAAAGGDALFRWGRHYSSAIHRERGPVGAGFRHSYMAKLELFAQGFRFETYQRRVYFFTPATDVGDVSTSNGYVLRREAADRLTISRKGEPTLHFAVSAEHDPRLILVSSANRRLLLEYDGGQLVGLQEGVVEGGVARLTARYLVQYYSNGFIYAVYRVEESTSGPSGGYTPLARYEYDPQGQLVRSVNALGGVYQLHYDVAGRVISMTNPLGYAFSWRYDQQGRCVETTGHDGLWWAKLQYFPGETHIQECSAGTFIHRFNAAGQLLEVVDPYGGVRKRELDPSDGRVLRETDAAGRVTDWLYDETGYHYARRNQYGQLQLPEELDGTSPDPHAPRVPRSAVQREFGIRPSPRAAFGPGTVLLRDASLETARAVVRHGAAPATGRNLEPQLRFNNRGDLIEEIEPSGRRRTWEYDLCGNLLAYSDADQRVYRQEIVRWNLLGTKLDPLGNAVRFQFTDNELVAQTTDPLGNVTTYEYDDKDRLVRVRRAGVVEEEYVYDVGDRLIQKRDALGAPLLTFEHDKRSLVKKVVLADGAEHSLDYDEAGKPTLASTNLHEVELKRDAEWGLVADLVDGHGCQVSHAGDQITLFGRFTFRRWRYGKSVSSSSSTNLTVWIDPTGRKHRVRFDESGLVRRETPARSVEFTRFDDSGDVDARTVERRAAEPVPTWTRRYERSREGDLLAIDDSLEGRTEYLVDAAHRVAAERSGTMTRRYLLDPADNLLEKPGLSGVVVGAHNTLVQANGRRFEYNTRTHVAESFDPATGRRIRYTYNARDLLVRIDVGHLEGQRWVDDLPAWVAEYDAIGRRLLSGRAGAQRRFYWREHQLIAEVADNGAVRLYGYVDEAAWVPHFFVDYDSVEADPASGRSYSIFGNHLGVPVAVEDSSGRIVWRATRVDPYGAIELDAANEIDLNLRWPGHYFDADTGLFYNRFRYYDPELGRYLQADPIGQRGGVNVYAYSSNPLRSVDVLGLHDETKNARSSGDSGDAHPGKKGPADADGKPTPKRDQNGKLRNEDGTFAKDPEAGGDKKITHRATKKPVETKAKLDPNDPKVKQEVDARNAANKERDDCRARGDEAGAKKAQAKANKATENLGNQAAEAHVKEQYPNAERMPASGEGPGTHDNVFKTNEPPPAPKYVVAEGKGGTATNSSSRAGPDGERYQQGTPEHFKSTNDQMANSSDPEKVATARELERAKPGEVQRIEVSQPLDSAGNPTDMQVHEYGPSEKLS